MMAGLSRRSFMTLASGLLLPYEPERVYSFVQRTRVERIVWVQLYPIEVWNSVQGFRPLTHQGFLSSTAEAGCLVKAINDGCVEPVDRNRDTPADIIGRVAEVSYGWHFANGDYELRNHA